MFQNKNNKVNKAWELIKALLNRNKKVKGKLRLTNLLIQLCILNEEVHNNYYNWIIMA